MGRIVDENYEPIYCDALEDEHEYVGKKLDLVEVVRCNDCKHYEKFRGTSDGRCGWWDNYSLPDDFCSRGEKEDGTD